MEGSSKEEDNHKEIREPSQTKENQITQNNLTDEPVQITDNDLREIVEKTTEQKILLMIRKIRNSKLLKKVLNFIKEVLVVVAFFFSVKAYIKSLEGCEGTQVYCLRVLKPSFFYSLGYFLILSALIVWILLILMCKKVISKIHLLYIFPSYVYLVHFYDKGNDLKNHGSINEFFFYSVLIILGVITLIIFLLYLFVKKRCFAILIMIFLFVFFVILGVYIKLHKSCANWNYGLNGVKIENDPNRDKCYFIQPKNCWSDMLGGWQDVSKLLGDDCTTLRDGERKDFIKKIPPKFHSSSNFAYPITVNFSWVNGTKQSTFDKLAPTVWNNLIDLDNTDILSLSEKPEVFLHFDKNKNLGTIKIKVQRREEIVQERQRIFDALPNNEKPRYNNFLFIYIDALSRRHFVRKMKNVISFLNKYLQKKDESKVVFQMMKGQSLNHFTNPNANPMFFGESLNNQNGTDILKAFKEKGFITAQSNNICIRGLYDLQESPDTVNLEYENFDHENIALFCDPTFYYWPIPHSLFLGPYSMRRRCLYGKDTFEYELEYGEQFWETYKNERKYLRLAFQDAHEGTGEVVRYLDSPLAKFLTKLNDKGQLNDTAIFIASDHGNSMIGIYKMFQLEDVVVEESSFAWFIILPNKVTKEEKKHLTENQQKLITPYDVHDTMLYIIGFNKDSQYHSRNGTSVFGPINSLERDCLTYQQDLEDMWCRCRNFDR